MAGQDTNTGETEDLAGASKSAPSDQVPTPNNLAEEVGLPVREITPERPLQAGALDNGLAHILAEVKLPERNDFRARADAQRASPALPLEPEKSLEPEAPLRPQQRDIVSAVHTLKDDFQTAVYDKKLSMVQAVALEETKRIHKTTDRDIAYAQTARRTRTAGTIVAIAALMFLGIVAFSAVFIIIRDRSGVEPSTFLVNGLLFSEQTIPIAIQAYSATELKRQLAGVRLSEGLTLGAITRVAPLIEQTDAAGNVVSREATTREFFKALDAAVPDELLRALGDDFFFGFHTVDENAPTLIFPVTSYERAFAGALAWEKTMNANLSPIFTAVPLLVQQTDGLLVERAFEDTVMHNYDVRILKDDSGAVQLYYSFPTRGLLIISESPYSFTEILARLRADRRL